MTDEKWIFAGLCVRGECEPWAKMWERLRTI